MSAAIGIGGSSSTSSPKMATGWHVLKVEGYSMTKDLPENTRIKSSTFTVGDHSWYIHCFPSGYRSAWNAKDDCIGVQLNLLNAAATSGEAFTRFNFSVLDHAGEKVPSLHNQASNIVFTFSSKAASYSVRSFMEKTKLESSYVKDDSFKIRCDVTVIKDMDAVES